MVSLPLGFYGAVPPRADSQDPNSAIAGVLKRAARKPPTPDPIMIKRFKTFVEKYVNENLEPLHKETDYSIETWLENVNYPLWRKQELHDLWVSLHKKTPVELINEDKATEVKAFIKQEFYDEFKYQRGIYSRTDIFKIAVGPIIKCIEKEIFKDEWFIKKIPVTDRPDYIKEKLSKYNGCAVATDYTSFEACFTKQIMESCEFIMYKHMVKNMPPEAKQTIDLFCDVIGGKNKIRFKHFSAEWDATRMSGEMNTSLGNGFTNMMIMKFLCTENGTKVEGVVEGDDGLFTFENPSKAPKEEQYEKLGFIVKMLKFERFNEASFCGLIFDIDEKKNITCPYYTLATFGWTESKYSNANENTLKMLLRAKGYSLAYQYPSCPILTSLAKKILELTHGYTISSKYIDSLDVYQREKLIESMKANVVLETPGIKTRLLMSDMYGVTVEAQLLIEKTIDEIQELRWINMNWFLQFFPPDYVTNWNCYVTGDDEIDVPRNYRNNDIDNVMRNLTLHSGRYPDWIRI